MTNQWNRFIYRIWAPFYDRFVGLAVIVRERQRALHLLQLQSSEHVLIVGVGTGPDLPFFPEGVVATGIDLSEAMLAKARAKLPLPGREITLQIANAEALPYSDETFDAAILFLILSVVADPRAALRETFRVLRPGGRAVIFDKFLLAGQKPSPGRRILNALVMRPFGTDINRSLEAMLHGLPATIVLEKSSLLRGAYRIVELRKVDA